MISNAKQFNQKTSQIYSDAEKVRKLVSNFMVERNPAYRDQTYQAVATPIPADWEPNSKKESTRVQKVKEEAKSEPVLNDGNHGRRSSRNAAHTPSEQDSVRTSSTPAVQDVEDDGSESFEGNTFQQAQAKIVREMMNLTDEE